MVATVTDREFTDRVLRSRHPVLVAFGASWCMPSQALVPIIEKVASEYEGKVTAVSVDADRSRAIAQRFKVNRLPVTMMICDGKVVDFIGGMTDQKNISDMVARRLAPVIEVSEMNFDREVLESPVPTLVHFGAAWCSASQRLLPLLRDIGERFRGRAKVTRVEFGPENARLCASFGIVRVPTTAVFVDGRLEDQIFGELVGGTKVGELATSCVGLTSLDNMVSMLTPFLL
jgi:thioredoxin 1